MIKIYVPENRHIESQGWHITPLADYAVRLTDGTRIASGQTQYVPEGVGVVSDSNTTAIITVRT